MNKKITIVGLGNPGAKYKYTRHNFGFLAVEALAEKNGIDDWQEKKDCRIATGTIGSKQVQLILPQAFMNNSGPALLKSLDKKTISDMLVVHDELDLPFGQMKLQTDKSAAGHNGVQSIIDCFGTKNFYRLRLGIGHTPKPSDTEKFVLEKFSKEEREALPQIIEKTVSEIENFIKNKK